MPQPAENEAGLFASRPMVILKGLHLGFSERAWWQFPVAMRPLAGPASASIFLVWVLPVILQARLLITSPDQPGDLSAAFSWVAPPHLATELACAVSPLGH